MSDQPAPETAVDRDRIRGHVFLDQMRREQATRREADSDRAAKWARIGVGAGVILLIFGIPWGWALIALSVVFMSGHMPPRRSSVGLLMEAAGNVTAVACPTCHAPVGDRCALPAFDVRVCHQERGRLYWDERSKTKGTGGAP